MGYVIQLDESTVVVQVADERQNRAGNGVTKTNS
jgi:hypothetical protein